MYKKIFLTLCFLLLLGFASSCGSGGSDGHHGAYYGWGDLTLYNYTSLPISALYLTPADELSWGPDQLISDIPSGGSFTITDIASDFYDVKAVITGAYSTYYGYTYDILIEDGYIYDLYAYNYDFTGSLEVYNDTVGAHIEAIYLSPAGSSTWGPNQITSPIAPGDFIHFYDLDSGAYDVLVVWDVGPDSEYAINIVSLTLGTIDAH
jgi:hypothetical protein